MNQTNKYGKGTERHLPKTDDHVGGSTGERRKDVEMKRKNEKYRLIEAFEQKPCVLRLQ